MAFQYLKWAYKRDGEGHFTRACSDRQETILLNFKESKLRLDLRNNILTMWVVGHWNRLLKEESRVMLDGALNNLM